MPLFSFRKRRYTEINPDEVLMDSSNLPQYDRGRFEGRLEKPISKFTLYSVTALFILIVITFASQVANLQIVHGDVYMARSERNLLRPVPIFAGRGVIQDRNGTLLAWNSPNEKADDVNIGTSTATSSPLASSNYLVMRREYATTTGLAHILGYVKYPSKDNNGFYYREDFEGEDGVEAYYNEALRGKNGSRLIEVDAQGRPVSENVVRPPQSGGNVTLSIDSRLQTSLYENIRDIAERVGFAGGAGVIMDVKTGEVLAVTSYPEYSSQIMSDKNDSDAIRKLLSDTRLPFLDRAVDGLYTPGSIVKPYIALGALTEKIIDPATVIVTNGSISVPNPYDAEQTSIFKDWKNLGPLDMRHAIAMSSDVYFYTIGGGYKNQKGLGILNIDKYLRLFSFGTSSIPSFLMSKAGTIPTPDWKKKTFNESWYLGDTYHTAIGQYGFQVTPVQIVRAVAAIANGGTVLTPSIIKGETLPIDHVIDSISPRSFDIVREGMRLSVSLGTSKALDVPYAHIAGKSGTAELGVSKDKVNSWITGFWPYENPKYAFVVTMEKGSVHNLIGAAAAMRQELDWMNKNTPEYFK